MRDNEMVVGKRQSQLVLQIVRVFREGIDFATHAPRMLAHGQVVALDPIGIDGRTHWRRLQGRCDLFGGAIHHPSCVVHSAAPRPLGMGQG